MPQLRTYLKETYGSVPLSSDARQGVGPAALHNDGSGALREIGELNLPFDDEILESLDERGATDMVDEEACAGGGLWDS